MVSRSPLRSIGRLALIVFCLGSVLILALFILPIYLDITAFKGPVEEILTEVIEAPVTVGEVHLDPSLWPTLRISEIRVEGTGWDEAPLFTAIDAIEIRLALLPLLRQELRIKKILASDMDIHLSRPEGRQGNWPEWTSFTWEVSELTGIELQNVTIYLDDHDIGQADAYIETLKGGIARHSPLELELRGALEGLPMFVAASGPTLAALSPQASDFPLAAQLELASLRLNLSGTASRKPTGTALHLEVEGASPDWEFVEVLEDLDIPEIGGFDMVSRVTLRSSNVELSDLRGTLGATTVHGALALDTSGNRPRVSGQISLGELDLQPWLERPGAGKTDTSVALPFELLSSCDLSVALTIDTVTGLEHSFDILETTVDLTDGDLSLPLDLQIADIPFSAEIALRQGDGPPEIVTEIHTQSLALDQLGALLEVPDGLSGDFGPIAISISTSGISVDDLIANLDVNAEASDVALSSADELGKDRFEVHLEQARVDHRTGNPLTFSTNGTFLEEDFRLNLETAPADTLLESNAWPFRVALQGSGAKVDANGTIHRQQEGIDLDLEFSAAGARLGDLEAWLGLPPDAGLTYYLSGHLRTAAGQRSLQLHDSALGRTQFEGNFSWDIDNPGVPLIVDLRASALDLQELQDLADPITDLNAEGEALGFDLPVLPSGVVLDRADIDLQIDRLYREPVDLTDIQASFTLRQGHLQRSPFSFSYAASEFNGELELDLRGEIPRFGLDLSGQANELHEILEQEDLVTDSGLTADRLELSIAAEGSNIRQIVKSAHLSGKLTDVRWEITLPDSEETLDLRLGVVDLDGPRGEPIVLESEGFLDGVPVQLRITIREFNRPEHTHGLLAPFSLQATIASTEVELEGEISLPITRGEFDLDLTVIAESLSDLSSLARRDLPNLGPYRLQGRVALNEGLLALQDFDLTLGESDLQGSLEYRQIEGRPTFDAKLLSQKTHSQDYLHWLHADDSDDEETTAQQRTFESLGASELSLDSLKEIDASIALEIDELDTGTGPLEHISAALELDNGRLLLLMQRPQETEKMAQIAAHIEPLSRGIGADLVVQWERQPYGLLADILNPGTAAGSWSLDLALRTQGASFDELLQNLVGHIDFTDYPTDFKATILDLWGGGLLGALLPVFNLGAESQINCTVGRFVVDEGVMTPELLALDATRSRVNMRGFIDLPNNYLKLRLNPRPKTRSLINLATPVKLRGPLDDPSVRFTTSGIAVTAFRFSLWVYTVWVDLLRRPLPRDGSDICLDPESRTP